MSLTQLSNELKAALENRFSEGETIPTIEELTASAEALIQEGTEVAVLLKHASLEAEGGEKEAFHKRAGSALKALWEKVVKFFRQVMKRIAEIFANSAKRFEALKNKLKLKAKVGRFEVHLSGEEEKWIMAFKTPGFHNFIAGVESAAKYISNVISRGRDAGDFAEEIAKDIKDVVFPAKGLPGAFTVEISEDGRRARPVEQGNDGPEFKYATITHISASDLSEYIEKVSKLSAQMKEECAALEKSLSASATDIEVGFLNGAADKVAAALHLTTVLLHQTARATGIVQRWESEVCKVIDKVIGSEEPKAAAESFMGIGRTIDEKIARKEKKIAEMRAEEKRLRGEFDKEGAKHDERVFGEIAHDIKDLEEEVAELKKKKAESKPAKESLDGGGLPTEPVNAAKQDVAARADDAADAEGKTAAAVQSVKPDTVASQEGVGAIVGMGLPLTAPIVGGVLGHRMEEASKTLKEKKKELEDHRTKLAALKKELEKVEHGHQASQEGWKGAAAGIGAGVGRIGAGMAGGPVVGVPLGAGLGAGMSTFIDQKKKEIRDTEKQIHRIEGEIHAVELELARAKGRASKESIEDADASDAQAAVDAAPVVDEAVVAAPAGGEKVVEVSEDHAPEESAEDALLAVNDASDAIDGSMRESTELEDAASGLESILLSIQEYPQGLTPQDAQAVDVNLESIVGDWELGQKLCPSYESFGGTNLRREATASLEANVREVLNSVYKYIADLFTKFANLVVNFYLRLTNVARAVSRRGAQLAARLEGIQVDAPTKNTVNIGTLAQRLTSNGQMPSLSGATGALMVEIDAALGLENHVQAIESAVGAAAAHLRGLTDETFSSGMEEITTAYLSATKAPAIFAQNGEVLQTRQFPGEIFYVAEQKDGHWRYRVVKTGKEPQGSTIHTPSKADLLKLANVLKVQGVKAARGIEAITERIKADKGQRFLSQVQGPANNLNDENQRAIAKFVQQCAEDVKAIHALGKEMLTNAAKGMLAVVRVGEISADLYKAPQAAAAKEGEAPKAVEGAAPAAGEEAPGGEAAQAAA